VSRRRTAAVPATDATPPGLDALLAAKEMVLVCGSGGVGKTTTAAALGLEAATHLGGRVLVVTVDPAKRLADALGLAAEAHGAEVLVPGDRFPVRPQGELWMAMLDTKAGWDDLVGRHAPDAATRDAILANPLYRNITGRFVHSHDYIAIERLHELHASGRYDLVIVDTPPSRHALDILDAPARMIDFFGGRLLRWLTVSYRSRILNMASRPFYQVADRILGTRFLQDIAEFFTLFQQMEAGFVRRARATEAMLADTRTTFVIVTTLESAPSAEALYLADGLEERGLPLGAIVANRVLPASLRSVGARTSATRLVDAADTLAEELGPGVARSLRMGPDAGAAAAATRLVATVLREIGTRYHDLGVVAARQAERHAELTRRCPLVVEVPWFEHEVDDLATLANVGAHAWGGV